MEKIDLGKFKLIGITVRTSNNNGEGLRDIGALWYKFMTENILDKIPNKVDNTVYSIYTEYAGDYTLPYTTLIGCKVKTLDDVPDGMRGMSFDSGVYQKFVAIGNMADNIVAKKWYDIWQTKIDRAYTQDFEVYGAKAQNPENAEVEIFIAVK